MGKPVLYDLFCGAGGACRGYQEAGFHVVGVDLAPQPRYCGDTFIQMDAFEFMVRVAKGEYSLPAAWHASPPCQGYSIMRNLPWLRERDYPLLILPTRQALMALGRPSVIENVAGARYGAAGLKRRGLEAHGLQAGYLCGVMFGKRFYRHRYFETSFFWLAPAHRRHRERTQGAHGNGKSSGRDFLEQEVAPTAAGVNHAGRFIGGRARVPLVPGDARGVLAWSGRRSEGGHGLTTWQERAVEEDRPCGVGHTAGIAAVKREMDCEWMSGDEVTQAIPTVYTRLIGEQLRRYVD